MEKNIIDVNENYKNCYLGYKIVNGKKIKLDESEINLCKNKYPKALEKLIQIKDPHVVGPLNKLTSKDHQEKMGKFINEYQTKNIKNFSSEYFKSLTKDDMNNMVEKYVKNTDFTKLIPNYHDLTPVQLAQKKMELFQGEDPN